MFKLPPAVQPIFDTLYGQDKWYRVWAILMTFCLLFCFRRSTRRLAMLTFIGLGIAAVIWNYLQTAYKQYTPDDTRDPHPRQARKWLR